MQLLRGLLYRLRRSLRVFREKGPRAGVTELWRTILRVFCQRTDYVVVAHTLSEKIPSPNPKPGLTIRQVRDREELATLNRIADEEDRARFYRLLDHGSIAFIASQDSRPVGYCWISEEIDMRVHRVQPPLSPGDAYVHDLFVAPTHRRQGIGGALVSHRLRFLRDHGCERVIAIVLKDNVPALKVDSKTGYTHVGEMTHTRILLWDLFAYHRYET